jgi:Dyp-type peroxidase family
MVSLCELPGPIDQDTLKALQQDARKPLESLQGNILQGHGRERSVHVFLRFKTGQEAAVKQWITYLAGRITSAQRQFDEMQQYRQYKIPGRLFMSFFLSAKGYAYFDRDFAQKQPGFDQVAFLSGMQAARLRLNDPLPATWEPAYRQPSDAMVLLADDDEPFLLRQVRGLLDTVKEYAEICAVEHGRAMRNAQGDSVEHFGYVDGRSQPLFFESDLERERQNMDGTTVWNPGVGPNMVLVPDPYGREEQCDSGSYMVFRKLEQNVRAFKEREKKLAQALGLIGENAERAGALVMGRFDDGTPIALQRTAGRAHPVSNNFNYSEDPQGLKCPLQAHMRRMNPRQPGFPRIVRRGITYGIREKEPKDKPSLEELPAAGVGLLFMCYQRNIQEQFEFLQGVWANDPRIPLEYQPGIDPIVGQPGASGVGQHKWPRRWGTAHEELQSFDFHGFVTLKGGEYFFAPSIHFLRTIEAIWPEKAEAMPEADRLPSV